MDPQQGSESSNLGLEHGPQNLSPQQQDEHEEQSRKELDLENGFSTYLNHLRGYINDHPHLKRFVACFTYV